MSEGSRTRVVVGAAAVAVGWKHRSTLLGYATLPARAFAGVLRAWCRGEEPAGLGRRAAVAVQGALGPEGSFARDRPLVVVGCAAVAGVSVLSLLDRAVGGRVRKALRSKTCRRAAIIVAGSATGAFCALEAYEGYSVRSPVMTHVLVCFGIEGISQAVIAAGSSRDFKKTFNNLAGRSKTLVFLALNVLLSLIHI